MGFWDYEIAELPLGKGMLGIAPLPGRTGSYQSDLNTILRWNARLVLTMNTQQELERIGVQDLGDDLIAAGVAWRHLPIPDFGAPPQETAALWPEVSKLAHDILADGGRVFSHCYGGCGRSGMALLRLIVEHGENVEPALERLRRVRPCAVETEAQKAWASNA